jgi:hypothetical protein
MKGDLCDKYKQTRRIVWKDGNKKMMNQLFIFIFLQKHAIILHVNKQSLW